VSAKAGTETGQAFPLTPDPSVWTSYGSSGAIADYSGSAITLVTDGKARTFDLPWTDRHLQSIAMTTRWIVLDDDNRDQLLVFTRKALLSRKPQSNPRLSNCH
jgi:hypothetical protein